MQKESKVSDSQGSGSQAEQGGELQRTGCREWEKRGKTLLKSRQGGGESI